MAKQLVVRLLILLYAVYLAAHSVVVFSRIPVSLTDVLRLGTIQAEASIFGISVPIRHRHFILTPFRGAFVSHLLRA